MANRAGKSFLDGLITGAALLGGTLFAVITLIVFYEIIARYLFNAPTTWSIDISVYMVMWATFLGGAYTLREGGHVHVDVVLDRFSPKRELWIKICIYILILAFCMVLAWQGARSCLDAIRFNEVTLSAHRFPMWLPLFAIPVGGLLLTLRTIRILIEFFHSLKETAE